MGAPEETRRQHAELYDAIHTLPKCNTKEFIRQVVRRKPTVNMGVFRHMTADDYAVRKLIQALIEHGNTEGESPLKDIRDFDAVKVVKECYGIEEPKTLNNIKSTKMMLVDVAGYYEKQILKMVS